MSISNLFVSKACKPHLAKCVAAAPAVLAFAIALGAPPCARADDAHDNGGGQGNGPSNVVYVQNNDYTAGRNAILAYRRNPANGCLTPLGTYYTGGTGINNFDDRIGPDDHAQEVIANRNRNLLFTVNEGSDNVSVFRINNDGTLTLAQGSPVSSNGIQPVSLGLAGDDLFVVNQNGDPNREAAQTTQFPNYTAFEVSSNGTLTPIAGSTFNLPHQSTPTQALISPNGQFFFGDLLSGVPFPSGVPSIAPGVLPAAGSELDSFRIKNGALDGHLVEAPNSPFAPESAQVAPTIPQARYTLGMDVHPHLRIVYIGYVVKNRLGVFTYDSTGSLHYVTDVGLGANNITVCWIKVSPDGKWVFTSNAGSNSIDVFDISGTVKPGSGPLNPVLVQSLPLVVPQPAPPAPIPGVFNTPTVSFQIEVDPSSNFLYAVGHELVLNNMYPQGNIVHTVKIGPYGQLSEPSCSPVQINGIPSGAHPQGLVVF